MVAATNALLYRLALWGPQRPAQYGETCARNSTIPPSLAGRSGNLGSGRLTSHLEIGAVGWRHDSWADTFYPDSLPEDWRLTFYSNEFRCLLVPDRDWSGASAARLAAWAEDVHEQFVFYLELDPGRRAEEAAEALARTEPIAARVGGIVARTADHAAAEPPAALLEACGGCYPVHLDWPGELAPAQRAALERLDVLPCWRAAGTEPRRGCRIGLLSAEQASCGRRALRSHIEAFLNQAGENGELALLFEGDPPDVQAMRDAQTIAGLLGG